MKLNTLLIFLTMAFNLNALIVGEKGKVLIMFYVNPLIEKSL